VAADALARREGIVAPRFSPAIFVHGPLESGVDVIDVREGAVHIGITKD
jgi:hypothetical protein